MTNFAFVFPGQGSQSRGMMNGYADFPVVRAAFAEASDILHQDLWQLAEEGSDAELNTTINTQPLMLTAGVAVYRVGAQPSDEPAVRREGGRRERPTRSRAGTRPATPR